MTIPVVRLGSPRAAGGGLPIGTASLVLRAFVPGDVPKVFAMSREESLQAWLPSQVYRDEAHGASVLHHLIACIDDPGDPRAGPFVLGVQLRATGELIGHAGLSPLYGGVEVGFAIEQAQQRRGFATEAVAALCRWAMASWPIPSIAGIAAAGNAGSQRVLERTGFSRVREESMRMQGVVQPVLVYALDQRPAATVCLVAAEAGDLEALVAIRIAAMRASLERIGRFDPLRARERFASGFSPEHTRHIVSGGRRVGFVVVKPIAGGLLLDHLYVLPAAQRCGIGAAVMAQVLAEADACAQPVRVGALRDSDANRFYARHGFALVERGEFDNYYVHPVAAGGEVIDG